MASASSTYATAYDAATSSRTGGPSAATRAQGVILLTDTFTIATSVNTGHDTATSGDYYDLGPAGFEGQVIPNLSFLSYNTGSTGALTNAHFTLYSYSTAGVLTALTGICDANGAVADYFADFTTPTTWPTVTKSDRLRVYLSNTEGTYTVGRAIQVNLATIQKHVS